MATIEQQLKRMKRIQNAFVNFKKLGANCMTRGACVIRLESLHKQWEEFDKIHQELEKSEEFDADEPYFTQDYHGITFESYLNNSGQFQDHFLKLKDEEERTERRSGTGEVIASMDYARA